MELMRTVFTLKSCLTIFRIIYIVSFNNNIFTNYNYQLILLIIFSYLACYEYFVKTFSNCVETIAYEYIILENPQKKFKF